MADDIKKDFYGKDILSLDQFDTSSITHLFETTDKLVAKIKRNESLNLLAGRVITLLFFEPSTRTFGSFSSAVKRLGGQTIDIQDPISTTSWVKGETLEDTIKVYEAYSDLIIIRHSEIGSANIAASTAKIPVVNAGDGGGEHPTQALFDLYTVHQKFGKLTGLKCMLGRDPMHSRTIRSFAQALAIYPNNTIYLLSNKDLRMSSDLRKSLIAKGLKIIEIDNEEDIPTDAHVWYWNRIQKERFKSEAELKETKEQFVLTKNLLSKKGNNDLIILDPLPRVDEISTEVDEDPRALYLRDQLKNGLYVRMSILALVLGGLR